MKTLKATTLALILAGTTVQAEGHIQRPELGEEAAIAAGVCTASGGAIGAAAGLSLANPGTAAVAATYFFMCFVVLGNHPELIGMRPVRVDR